MIQRFKSVFIIRRILKEAQIPWYRVQYKLMNEQDWVAVVRSAGNYTSRLNFPVKLGKLLDEFFVEYQKKE